MFNWFKKLFQGTHQTKSSKKEVCNADENFTPEWLMDLVKECYPGTPFPHSLTQQAAVQLIEDCIKNNESIDLPDIIVKSNKNVLASIHQVRVYRVSEMAEVSILAIDDADAIKGALKLAVTGELIFSDSKLNRILPNSLFAMVIKK